MGHGCMTSLRTVPTTLRHFLAAHWRWRTLKKEGIEGYQSRQAQRIVEYANAHSSLLSLPLAGL